jgi:hypothetical protein
MKTASIVSALGLAIVSAMSASDNFFNICSSVSNLVRRNQWTPAISSGGGWQSRTTTAQSLSERAAPVLIACGDIHVDGAAGFCSFAVMTGHEYQPFFHRQPDDHAAAVAAFRRLHMYAVAKGDRALAALATLKALQKVENEAELDGDKELRSLILPTWVRSGMWDALAQLLGKKAPRGRSKPFSQSMNSLVHWRRCPLSDGCLSSSGDSRTLQMGK